MKELFILLRFGASTTEPLSSAQTFGFWGIVILLVVLFVIFYIRTNKLVIEKQKASGITLDKQTVGNENDVEEEIAASIAVAIHMYQTDLHDKESFTITLKKVSRIYSPWSSKIYTLRQNPR